MAYSEAQKRADAKYKAKCIKQIKFNFHKELDADVLDQLEKVGNKQGYIKELIRADIAKQKKDS